jgi:CSLREA domain-containing protein
VGSGRTLNSQGNNRFTTAPGGSGVYIPGDGDHEGSVDYVVTSVADTYDGDNDPKTMSLRDAIHQANIAAGVQEIWLPAWKLVLTRERTSPPTQVETFVDQGDLEVKESLIIRGVDEQTSVSWRPGAAIDLVFELMGDYNFDGVVDTADDVMYGKGVPEADGDDDGDVDAADNNIINQYLSQQLTLLGVND